MYCTYFDESGICLHCQIGGKYRHAMAHVFQLLHAVWPELTFCSSSVELLCQTVYLSRAAFPKGQDPMTSFLGGITQSPTGASGRPAGLI